MRANEWLAGRTEHRKRTSADLQIAYRSVPSRSFVCSRHVHRA